MQLCTIILLRIGIYVYFFRMNVDILIFVHGVGISKELGELSANKTVMWTFI